MASALFIKGVKRLLHEYLHAFGSNVDATSGLHYATTIEVVELYVLTVCAYLLNT